MRRFQKISKLTRLGDIKVKNPKFFWKSFEIITAWIVYGFIISFKTVMDSSGLLGAGNLIENIKKCLELTKKSF